MQPTRKTVREIILGDGRNPSLAEECLGDLEPFLRRCEAGTYSLDPSGRPSESEVASLLAGIIGPDIVRRVVFAQPEGGGSDRPPWLAKRAEGRYQQDHPAEALAASIDRQFSEVVADHFTAEVRQRLDGALYGTVSARLTESIGNGLRTAAEKSLGNDLQDLAYRGFWPIILCFACAAVSGNADTIRRLRPLVAALTDAAPLGEKADEPGTWIVLRLS